MGLALKLTLIDVLQNDVKVKGQISVLIFDLSLKWLLLRNYLTQTIQMQVIMFGLLQGLLVLNFKGLGF